MKRDKIIKDLKERNDKLLEQYRYRDIRCITLENRLEKLQQELNQKNKIIEEMKEYVNFLVIFNQNINGKFSETQWGEDILGFIEELEQGSEE